MPDPASIATPREAEHRDGRVSARQDGDELADLYEASLEASGAKLYCYEIGGADIVWRSATPDFFGHPLETVALLTGWKSLIIPEDQGLVEAVIAAAIASEQSPTRITYRIIDGSGNVRWLESHGQLQWRDGRAWRAIGFLIDVTQRAVLEQDLLLHSKIIEAIADGVTLSTEDGKTVLVNREIERAYGWSRDELIGRSTRVFSGLEPRDHDRLRDYVRATVFREGIWRGETRERRRDGTVLRVRRTMSVLDHGRERLWVGTRTDVTQLRQLEREILSASEREQQRLASLLHEGLGQKLTGAALVATAIARDAQKSGDGAGTQLANLAALLNEAVGDCRRLAQQVRGFVLEYAGLEMGLRALLMRFESEYDVACTGQAEPELVDGLGVDRGRLVYKIAADMLAAAVGAGTPSMISLELRQQDGRAQLRMSDDGLGEFPADHLRRIHYQATTLDGVIEATNHDEGGRALECIFPIA